MPRPPKFKCVWAEPLAQVFKPRGIPARALEALELQLDELEALRLADLEGLYHDAAAERLGVSRATFGRLIARARGKVADALVNGKMLVMKGGPVVMMTQRNFVCAECGERFAVPHGAPRPAACPACGSASFHRAPEERGGRRWGGRGGRCRGRGYGRGGSYGRGRGRGPLPAIVEEPPSEAEPITAADETPEHEKEHEDA